MPASPELTAALRALARFREEQPALAKWIADGAPNLTDAEHMERFGEAYRSTTNRRKAR